MKILTESPTPSPNSQLPVAPSSRLRNATMLALLASLLVMFLLFTTTAYSEDPGYALLFDGNNDFVVLDETSQILGPGWEDSKSVSLWVKPTGAATCTHPGPASCDAIFGDRARWWGISRGEVNGLDRIWVWNWDTNGLKALPIEYTVDEWIHIALVHDDNMLRAFKFGVEVGSIASDTTQQPNTGAQPVLHIGGIMNNGDRIWAFSGEIDEVRLWNYGRTAEQLTADMLTSLDGDETGLMAYYQMSDGSGLTLTDDSVHDWDGALEDGGGIVGVPPDGHYPEWVTSGAFADPPPTSTPTNTPTASATPVQTATSTPTSTGTPTTPTATVTGTPPSPTATVTGTPPSPTATVTGTPPSPTATSEPTPDELIYLPLFIDR